MSAELWFDGGCEPRNPGGHMVASFVLRIAGHPSAAGSKVVPASPANTNNIAEWQALRAGVESFIGSEHRSAPLVIRGDSKLVINQLNNNWACHKEHLAEIRRDVWLMLRGAKWRAEWIQREQNEEADALGRVAYQEFTGSPMPTREKFRRTA